MSRPSLLALAGVLCGMTGAIAAPQTLVLDTQHSNLEVHVRATWGAFVGRVQKFHSNVLIEPSTGRVTRVELAFQFGELHTGISRRDRDMLMWEEGARFPEARFRLDALEPAEGGGSMARGSLFLHGVEHAVSFPVSSLIEGTLYSFDGEVPLDYRDFGLPLIRKFYFLTVDPHMQVRFHLQGRLAGPAS